jgi:hypothetical protein
MKISKLGYALLLSVLLNLGVIGGLAYHALQEGRLAQALGARAPELPDALGLDPAQRAKWHALEADFLGQFDAAGKALRTHREQLVHAIFSDHPDAARIEAERRAIAELQERQQQRVIAQFLKEREILDEGQRRVLAEALLAEPPATPPERQLHRGN